MTNENKFTKGEWVVKPGASTNYNPNIVAIAPNGVNRRIVAQCLMNTPNGLFLEEAEANAKLISCAPEMLDKLKLIHQYFSSSAGNDLLAGGRMLIESIEPLIKKATS